MVGLRGAETHKERYEAYPGICIGVHTASSRVALVAAIYKIRSLSVASQGMLLTEQANAAGILAITLIIGLRLSIMKTVAIIFAMRLKKRREFIPTLDSEE